MLLVGIKLFTIPTERQGVTRDPLIGVLASLGSHALDPGHFAEINLQPLRACVLSRAPGPSVVDSSVPRSKVMVIVSGGGHVTTLDSVILDTKWHIALA